MAHVLFLLLPALIPSWRFFKTVEPSPRLEWMINKGTWREYRPRPFSVSGWQMARRLIWNPQWNDALYMVSLAERLTVAPDDQTLNEIWNRLGRDLAGQGVKPADHVRFRLVFVSRAAPEVTYFSEMMLFSEIAS